jgi:hypothetical protein
MKTRKNRINGCTIIKNGVVLYCRWQTGFKDHVKRLVNSYAWGENNTTCAWNGKAEVVLDKKDFLLNKNTLIKY